MITDKETLFVIEHFDDSKSKKDVLDELSKVYEQPDYKIIFVEGRNICIIIDNNLYYNDTMKLILNSVLNNI